jgi:branched-chain amino acid transport system permease protein
MANDTRFFSFQWFTKHGPRNIGLLLLLFLLILFPFAINNRFYVALIADMLTFGLMAMSVDILIGYTGLVPFGHAAYFGLGAYALGLFSVYISSSSIWLLLLVGILVPSIIAIPFGWLQVRLGGIAFALLSMAFSMMFYTFFWKWRNVTGGDDGLPLLELPDIGIGNFVLGSVDNFTVMYFFVLCIVLILFLIVWRVIHSPFGFVLLAIRENEERASFVGINVRRFKLLAFILAGAVAGTAGCLHALHRIHLVPDLLHWSTSGEALIMALLGGVGTLWGPFLGSAVFIFAKDYVSTVTEHWMIFIGLLVILIVYFMPRGLVGLGKYLRRSKEEVR